MIDLHFICNDSGGGWAWCICNMFFKETAKNGLFSSSTVSYPLSKKRFCRNVNVPYDVGCFGVDLQLLPTFHHLAKAGILKHKLIKLSTNFSELYPVYRYRNPPLLPNGCCVKYFYFSSLFFMPSSLLLGSELYNSSISLGSDINFVAIKFTNLNSLFAISLLSLRLISPG